MHTSDNASIMLKNMLHVPHIRRNLMNIAKLTTDNNVVVEFNSNFCFVKDKDTRRVMLQGVLKDGLYQLELPSIQKSSSTVSSNSPFAAVYVSSNKLLKSESAVSKPNVCAYSAFQC